MGGWTALPYPGGLLDQPSDLMDDILQWKYIVGVARRIKDSRDGN